MVNEFKYLGYWFTPRNTGNRHIRQRVGKAKKATNTVRGGMGGGGGGGGGGEVKKAKMDKLRERLTLMDSLIKAGALYGVEL